MTSNRILLLLVLATLISFMKCFVLQYNNSLELYKPRRDPFNETIASESTCREDTECAYGGICKDFDGRKNCVCKEGLEGDFCQVVTECVGGKYKNCKGEKGTCLYSIQHKQAICTCSEYQVLDEENNECKEIRCEKKSCHGGTCRVIDGTEICTCPPSHYLQEDTCIVTGTSKSPFTTTTTIHEPEPEKGGCFHGSSIILTPTGEKLMKDIQLGDEVASGFHLDGSLTFSPVIAFLHKEENMESSFIQLKTDSNSTLLVTDSHLVFRSTDQNSIEAVHANQIRVGDFVYTNLVGELGSKSTVTALASQTMTGVFAPLTIDGTVVVNNILASCYAEVDSHSKGHLAFLPLRFHYYVTNAVKSLEWLWNISLSVVDERQHFQMQNIDSSKAEVLQKLSSQGIHWYPKMLCWLTNSNCK